MPTAGVIAIIKAVSFDSRNDVVALAKNFPGGHHIPEHQHDRAQLVYASEGVMRVTTEIGSWVVPSERAVWIPAGVLHQVHMPSPVSMRTLYFRTDLVPELPGECSVVNVTPLLRELILRAMSFDTDSPPTEPQKRLTTVLIDEVRVLPVAPFHLPLPRDARLKRLTDALRNDPGETTTLASWGKQVGASSRTLARLFRQETGMSFRQWREQLRLILAIEKLAGGEQVTTVAMDLGYDSVSAFINMFCKNLGTTPSRYFARGNQKFRVPTPQETRQETRNLGI